MTVTAQIEPGNRRKLLGPPSLEKLSKLRRGHHSGCIACRHPMFRLEFARDRAGVLVARFRPTSDLCSYRGVIHGGVVSLLIDEAMTCCLMAHGVVGMTGELKLRYLHPVSVTEPIEIWSRVATTYSRLYHLESDLKQGGVTKVRGEGRFLRRAEEAR